jgi:hypothetical protein
MLSILLKLPKLRLTPFLTFFTIYLNRYSRRRGVATRFAHLRPRGGEKAWMLQLATLGFHTECGGTLLFSFLSTTNVVLEILRRAA